MNKEDYYKMQKPNLLYPNEKYINSETNINKADLVRMKYVYEDILPYLKTSGVMVDVGCNDGYFMRQFEWPFELYYGVDMFSIEEYLSTNNIDRYTKGGKIQYITGLFEEINLDIKADFIFAGEVIEHVLDVNVFLKKISAMLKPNAWACITTPNNIGGDLPEHHRQYNRRELEETLLKFFKEVEITELPSIGNSWPFLYAKCRN